ncbi:unnamed protein product, partial [Staurois parvus]
GRLPTASVIPSIGLTSFPDHLRRPASPTPSTAASPIPPHHPPFLQCLTSSIINLPMTHLPHPSFAASPHPSSIHTWFAHLILPLLPHHIHPQFTYGSPTSSFLRYLTPSISNSPMVHLPHPSSATSPHPSSIHLWFTYLILPRLSHSIHL